jgi:MFS family permease
MIASPAKLGHNRPNKEEDDVDVVYIDWEQDDAEHPQNWSTRRKWCLSFSVMLFTFVSTEMPSGYYLAFEGFHEEYGTSRPIYMLGMFFYLAGHAFAPMMLAPISENIGRYPVMMISSAGNLILFLGNSCATNVTTLIVTRALQGIIGSASNSMSGGFMADMFPAEKRGAVLSVYSLVFFGASSLSPIWASWVAFKLSWRWIFWIQGASCLVSFGFLVFFLREVRPDILLMKRAKKATKETGLEYRTTFMDINPTLIRAMQISITRPFKYLFTEPVVIFYSIWLAFVCGCTYFLLGAIPLIFGKYGWNTGKRGLPHVGYLVGIILGFIISLTVQERLFKRSRLLTSDKKPSPEARLYFALVGAVLFPIGALMLALTGRASVHWIWPITSLGVIALGCFPIFVSGYTYLSDTYETYASSALAAVSTIQLTTLGTTSDPVKHLSTLLSQPFSRI